MVKMDRSRRSKFLLSNKYANLNDTIKVLPTFVRRCSPATAIQIEKNKTSLQIKELRKVASKARSEVLYGKDSPKPIDEYKREFRMRKLNDEYFIVVDDDKERRRNSKKLNRS